jgi:hypothetical protein
MESDAIAGGEQNHLPLQNKPIRKSRPIPTKSTVDKAANAASQAFAQKWLQASFFTDNESIWLQLFSECFVF